METMVEVLLYYYHRYSAAVADDKLYVLTYAHDKYLLISGKETLEKKAK